MAGLSLSYDPPGETLRAFRKSDAVARALIGPISGGRKTCAVHDILLRAAYSPQRRFRWIAVRLETERLEAETIAAWHKAVPPTVGDWDPKTLRHQLHFAYAGKPKDIDIQFLAMDRPEQRKRFNTIEATGFWLDGARDLDESVFEKSLELAGSWPLDEKANPSIICTSRMPGEDHWLASDDGHALFRQPGGRTAHAENLKHLKPGFYQRLALGRTAQWVKTYVDAEWGSSRRAGSLEDLILKSYQVAE